MIVGKGDIAGVLPDRDDLLFFASGVSNSAEDRESEYKREIGLLFEQPEDEHIVYFSSIGVLDGISRYYDHKRYMENMARSWRQHTIVRLGNIAWGDNPNTFLNYMQAHPEAEVRNEYRYVVDKEEFLYWVDLIPSWSCEINIPGKRMKVQEALDEYARTHNPEV